MLPRGIVLVVIGLVAFAALAAGSRFAGVNPAGRFAAATGAGQPACTPSDPTAKGFGGAQKAGVDCDTFDPRELYPAAKAQAIESCRQSGFTCIDAGCKKAGGQCQITVPRLSTVFAHCENSIADVFGSGSCGCTCVLPGGPEKGRDSSEPSNPEPPSPPKPPTI